MLFVIGTEPAVVRAAVVRPALEAQRQVAGLDEVLLAAEVGRVGRDQRLLRPMLRAALEKEDVIALDDDLGVHKLQARLAQRHGLAVGSCSP